MKRPTGLILVSIALGFLALGQLLLAAIMVFSGVFMKRSFSSGHAAQPIPPGMQSLLGIFMLAFAFAILLFAAWSIFTTVGLLRLKNWGRVSILILGGLLTGFGVLACVFSLLTLVVGSPAPTPPNVPPHLMQMIMGFTGLFYGAIAAVGVWWLIYFTRPAIRSLFVPQATHLQHYAVDGTPLVLPFQIPQRKPGHFDHIPVPIAVFACLFLLSAVVCPLVAFLPFPAFVLGFILTRPASSVLLICIGVIAGLTGAGLLRLDNRARIAAMAWIGFGVVNMALSLLPWYQSQFRLYNQQLMARFHFPGTPEMPIPYYSGPYIVMISSFSLILYGVVFWFLQRHRSAFLAPPPPPPLPQ